ncbi:crystallin J1A-like isoform X2 [Dunckerocampus dactyliophorus]|uniref:crystallin J1A-like isoform X2 n=1 Tax=Dunckerocampus dactyliophorus TaxID=161453 RepID=UPI0024064FBD|nr:crystallin J1A-like isoform X2 [Dunckerocampus dactyliophorus]
MASSVQDRAVGAIIGAAVADAAAQPMHWIYNPERLKEVLADLEPTPEFRADSANPFYRRKTGEQTCYGDQAYVLLESLSQCGDVNVEDLTRRIYKFFGPGTVYDLPLNDPYRKKGGPKAVLPIDGPWRNGSLKAFIRNVDAGKEETGCDVDCQMDGVTKLAPVVAFYAGRPEMLEKVEQVMRVTQNNDMCVAVTLAAARFLEHFILNGPSSKAVDAVLAQLKDPQRQNPQDLDNAVIALPGAFQGALHGVLTLKQLDEAVRNTMRCGGCTASRASFIGACFGAQTGLQGIPESWKKRTLRYPQLLELAENMFQKTA